MLRDGKHAKLGRLAKTDRFDTAAAFQKLGDKIFSLSICGCRLRNVCGHSEFGVSSKIERLYPTLKRHSTQARKKSEADIQN